MYTVILPFVSSASICEPLRAGDYTNNSMFGGLNEMSVGVEAYFFFIMDDIIIKTITSIKYKQTLHINNMPPRSAPATIKTIRLTGPSAA